MSLRNYVKMALSTTMVGWSMRRVREALRREEGLSFGNTKMWGLIQELRDRGEVPDVSRNVAMTRKPSVDDASLEKRVRKIVGYVGKDATVRYVMTLFKDQSLRVDKDRLSRVLSKVKSEMNL